METWLLGVDAGGTRTLAALWKYGTDTVHFAETGPGNPWSVGPEFAADAIESACAQVLALGGMHLREVRSVVLGIAGNGRSGAPHGFAERVETWGLPADSVVTSDLDIATVAGLGHQPGIHVVAGTGSALMVQNASGERVQLGGWGWFLGDEGSAFDVGCKALRWLARAFDHESAPPPLFEALREWTGLNEPQALLSKVSDPARERPWIASLARVVLERAKAGDSDALDILNRSVAGLVSSISFAIARVRQPEPVRVSFSGGMFRSDVFTECYQNHLDRSGWNCRFVNTLSNPITGALRIAQKNSNLADFAYLKDVIALHCA